MFSPTETKYSFGHKLKILIFFPFLRKQLELKQHTNKLKALTDLQHNFKRKTQPPQEQKLNHRQNNILTISLSSQPHALQRYSQE